MRKFERGAALLEILVLLLLIAAITPLIYQSRVRKMNELEALNISGQIGAVGQAVERYVQANWDTGANLKDIAVGSPYTITLNAAFKDQYLPKGLDMDSAYLKDVNISLIRDAGPPNKISGIVLGPNKLRSKQISDLMGNQISALMGRAGGFVPSPHIDSSLTNAHGSGGFWLVDLQPYFPSEPLTRFETSIVYKLDVTADQIVKISDDDITIVPMESKEFYLSRVQKTGSSNEELSQMVAVLDMGGYGFKNVGAIEDRSDWSGINTTANFRYMTFSGQDGIDLQGNSDRMSPIKNVGALTFKDDNGNLITIEDRVFAANGFAFDLNPDGVSSVKNIRIDGKPLSDFLPGVMLQNIVTNVKHADVIDMPTCPTGYEPLIELIPQMTKTFCEEPANATHPRCVDKRPAQLAGAYLDEYFQTPLIVPTYNSCRPLKYFRTLEDLFGETDNSFRLPVDGNAMQTFNFTKTSGGQTKINFAPQLTDFTATELTTKKIFEKLNQFAARVHGALGCITDLKDKEGYLVLNEKVCPQVLTEEDYSLKQAFKVLETEVIYEGTSNSLPKVNVCRVYVADAGITNQSFIDQNPPIAYDGANPVGQRYYYLTEKAADCDPFLPGNENLNKTVRLKQRPLVGTANTKYFEKEICYDNFTLYTGTAPENKGEEGKLWEYYAASPAAFERTGSTLRFLPGAGTPLTRYDVFLDENRTTGNGTPLRGLKKVPVLGQCTDFGATLADIAPYCGNAAIDIPGFSCSNPNGDNVDGLQDKFTAFKLTGQSYTCITEWVDIEDGNEKVVTYARRIVDNDNEKLKNQIFSTADVGGTLSVEAKAYPDNEPPQWRINAAGVESMDARIYCRRP